MADNVNLSPEMITNLVNMLKSNESQNQPENGSLNNILQKFSSSKSQYKSSNYNNQNASVNNANQDTSTNSNAQNVSSESNSGIFGNLDIETILKLKSILETLNNENDQDSKLLYSLKPYLRKSKQEKLDQYINILKISQVSKLFKKGDAI